ncbi:MAG TPA: hypothetical protein VJ904_04300 [Tichowtungia sp.]|nr:hypothetical protein [Tichowtungia sp.]
MMNAKKLEKWILLEQTGELSPRKQKILNACPQAQVKRDELNALFSAVPDENTEPSPWALTRIHARLQNERRPVLLPARVWTPVLALAACLMLVFTLIDFSPESAEVSVASVEAVVQDEWTEEFEDDLAELESLILAMSDTPLDIMER